MISHQPSANPSGVERQQVPDAAPWSVARASARYGFKITIGGGAIAGTLIGALVFGWIFIKAYNQLGIGGLLSGISTGFLVGAVYGSIISLPLGLINSAVVAGITWIAYTYDLNVRTYRWILLLCVPSLDMLAIQLVWSAFKKGDLFFLLTLLLAGIGAIIGSVVQSRWYERTMALLNERLKLTALGYNPDISTS